MSRHSIPTRPARDDADPATGWHPRERATVRATVVNGWDVRPTLDRASATGRSLAQAAGSLVAGSPLPQALIQCRQRLTMTSFDWARWSSCRGQHRSLWPTTRRWPSPRRPLHRARPRPRTDRGHAATPHPAPNVTPRTSLRAEQRVCMPLSHGTSPARLECLRLRAQN